MVYVKWTFLAVIAALVFSFLHYTLPQHDIVRITNTEVRRIDFGDNSIFWAGTPPGTASGVPNRDVHFIETFRPNDKPMVYRNQDTGWGWPPYFKVNTSNLQAMARDLISTKENPQWVVVTHYGWRNEYLSIYPNAVGVRPAQGPDEFIIPWFNIAFLTALGVFFAWLWTVFARFKENRIEPLIDDPDSRAGGILRRLFGGGGR
ncbi:DUF1523 family protein [Rhodovulum strictum]|uniref:DUF1523 family protein n=1 Tax=Rhodovulum strictum TaxID=58314 RepID=A0A844BAS0_9RHOB|nr:DUF1523 family protein [Rhodovulum strictum]MRH21524.1 DUF1523 family protein [Rhodovulum strictum]